MNLELIHYKQVKPCQELCCIEDLPKKSQTVPLPYNILRTKSRTNATCRGVSREAAA